MRFSAGNALPVDPVHRVKGPGLEQKLMRSRSPWIAHWIPKTGAPLRLFCFPYAGAGPSIYREWGRNLHFDIDIVPVQLPGRESRSTELPYSSIQELVPAVVEGLSPYTNVPFALFGHSMGALVAFETARLLIQRGHRSPEHLIVSGGRGPQEKSPRPPIHLLPDDEFIEELKSYSGTPDELLQCTDLIRHFLPLLRADFTACETYVYAARKRLDIPITVYGALEDLYTSHSDLQGWVGETSQPCRIRMFPGGHFFLRDHPNDVLKALEKDLSRHGVTRL
jgi:medium-chain acyl-[acyl-carrier-protein] hydrolase